MAATVSYEVHVMRGGRWVTAGVYQDRNNALRDASGVTRRRYLGVRVVEEILDPERDRYVTRTIYRDHGRAGAGTASQEAQEVRAMAAAMGETVARLDQPFKAAAFALIGISSVMLAGIFGLFWLGLV